MRERTHFIALIRKSADHIMPKLAVGADHRDLHATAADGLIEMEIVIGQPLNESSASCSE